MAALPLQRPFMSEHLAIVPGTANYVFRMCLKRTSYGVLSAEVRGCCVPDGSAWMKWLQGHPLPFLREGKEWHNDRDLLSQAHAPVMPPKDRKGVLLAALTLAWDNMRRTYYWLNSYRIQSFTRRRSLWHHLPLPIRAHFNVCPDDWQMGYGSFKVAIQALAFLLRDLIGSRRDMAVPLGRSFAPPEVLLRQGAESKWVPQPDCLETPSTAVLEGMVRSHIKKLSVGASPGLDDIPIPFLKHACLPIERGRRVDHVNVLVPLIARMLRVFLNKVKMPACWKVAKLSPLHRRGAVSNPGNYRMIAISGVMYRINANMLKDLVADWGVRKNKVPDTQFGVYPDLDLHKGTFSQTVRLIGLRLRTEEGTGGREQRHVLLAHPKKLDRKGKIYACRSAACIKERASHWLPSIEGILSPPRWIGGGLESKVRSFHYRSVVTELLDLKQLKPEGQASSFLRYTRVIRSVTCDDDDHDGQFLEFLHIPALFHVAGPVSLPAMICGGGAPAPTPSQHKHHRPPAAGAAAPGQNTGGVMRKGQAASAGQTAEREHAKQHRQFKRHGALPGGMRLLGDMFGPPDYGYRSPVV
eukprot:1162072-Pelagomonas_calceolata.AAC.5